MKNPRLRKLYMRTKHFVVDGLLLRGWRFKMPKELIIETTNVCSLACSCCPNGCDVPKRPRGMMSRATFDRVLAGVDISVRDAYLHMCGEPFLNKELGYFAHRLAERGITPIVFSNGYNIDETLLRSLLDIKRIKISFSADLISAETYESIRKPARYSKMLEMLDGIEKIFAEHKMFYSLNAIVSADMSVEKLDEAVAKLFDRYAHLNCLSLNSQWPWPHLPQTGNLAGHMTRERRLCENVKGTTPILWNGDVAFCPFDYSGETVIGNIFSSTFRRIYNGRKARRIRRRLYMQRYAAVAMCNDCALPRYEAFSMKMYRNKYLKSDQMQRAEMLGEVCRYNAIKVND